MKKQSNLFILMIMIYTTCLLVSNVNAFKVVDIFGLTLTAATLVFPITYILGDVFSEVYGFHETKKIILYGFLCNALMVIVFFIAIMLPYPDTFKYQKEFSLVLSNTPRILVASLTAYLIGGLSNSYVLNFIKDKTKIKALWFRLFASTVVGELLDSLFFVTIGFIGSVSIDQIITMIFSQAGLKILIEFIMIPIVYKVIGYVKKYEKITE